MAFRIGSPCAFPSRQLTHVMEHDLLLVVGRSGFHSSKHGALMLDLNDVALFVQVVRAGSFAAAARRLGMPANSASRHIQQLEQQLGLRLMQRSTRKLTLTDAGASFYARCADQVEALAEAAQELGEASHVPSGRVRVAAPADFFNV